MKYVIGFAFDGHGNVLMVRKTKPQWQDGLLNGVGGAIEVYDKNSRAAMVREFREETGLEYNADMWNYITTLDFGDVELVVYALYSDGRSFDDCHLKTNDVGEMLELVSYDTLFTATEMCVSNVPWLIGMCLDNQLHNAPCHITFEEKL